MKGFLLGVYHYLQTTGNNTMVGLSHAGKARNSLGNRGKIILCLMLTGFFCIIIIIFHFGGSLECKKITQKNFRKDYFD